MVSGVPGVSLHPQASAPAYHWEAGTPAKAFLLKHSGGRNEGAGEKNHDSNNMWPQSLLNLHEKTSANHSQFAFQCNMLILFGEKN